MSTIRVLLPFTILLAAAFADNFFKPVTYQSGPLPYVHLKKKGFDLTTVALRAIESPPPGKCTECCDEQRTLVLVCATLDNQRAQLRQATEALTAAQANLDGIETAIDNERTELTALRNQNNALRAQRSALRDQIRNGDLTREEKVALRETRRELLAQMQANGARIRELRAARGPLRASRAVAQQAVREAQNEMNDQQRGFDRALRQRDRVQSQLDRCLGVGGDTDTGTGTGTGTGSTGSAKARG